MQGNSTSSGQQRSGLVSRSHGGSEAEKWDSKPSLHRSRSKGRERGTPAKPWGSFEKSAEVCVTVLQYSRCHLHLRFQNTRRPKRDIQASDPSCYP